MSWLLFTYALVLLGLVAWVVLQGKDIDRLRADVDELRGLLLELDTEQPGTTGGRHRFAGHRIDPGTDGGVTW